MIKAFVGSDVIIDFLTRRDPFAKESMSVFEFSSKGKIQLYTSSISISNVYYIISKLNSEPVARERVKLLLQLVEILPVGKEIIEKALFSEFKDFEDGIQNYCAETGKVKSIITRNVKDYSKSDLSIQTPKEFLADLNA